MANQNISVELIPPYKRCDDDQSRLCAGQLSDCQVRVLQFRAGQVRLVQVRAGQVHSFQNRIAQVGLARSTLFRSVSRSHVQACHSKSKLRPATFPSGCVVGAIVVSGSIVVETESLPLAHPVNINAMKCQRASNPRRGASSSQAERSSCGTS